MQPPMPPNLADDECLPQAEMSKKKSVPTEVSRFNAEIARKQAERMTPQERVDRAKKAADARWKKSKRRKSDN